MCSGDDLDMDMGGVRRMYRDVFFFLGLMIMMMKGEYFCVCVCMYCVCVYVLCEYVCIVHVCMYSCFVGMGDVPRMYRDDSGSDDYHDER
jgi:hypothetical protein